MWARSIAAVVWMLVAASALAWGWRFQREPLALPAQVPAEALDAAPVAGSNAELLRLLGTATADSGAAAAAVGTVRYQLQGVIAGLKGRSGVALIAIDDKPARAYAVGTRVDGQRMLESLGTRSARLNGQPGVPAITIEMAPAPAGPTSPTPTTPVAALSVPVPVAGVAEAQPPTAVAPAPLAAPGVRMAAPGEMVEPGRRLRLRTHAGAANSHPAQ